MYEDMTQRNHFVPRGYLRFFCNNNQRIIVYDKETKKEFPTTVENICVKKNIYNGVENYQEISWEDFYTNIDKNLPYIINKIKQSCELHVVNKPLQVENLKQDMALIMIIQMLRTPERIFSQTRLYNEILNVFLKKLDKKEVSDKEEKINILNKYFSREYYKGIALRGINSPESLIKYMKVLLNKTWVIYKNNTDKEFVTSDNPIILYNFMDKTIGMKNGIGRPDTVIIYPITPKYLIELVPKQYLFGSFYELYDNKCIQVEEERFIKKMNEYQYENAIRQIYKNQ